MGMAAFADLAISVLHLLGQKHQARAMDDFQLRPNSTVAAVRAVTPCCCESEPTAITRESRCALAEFGASSPAGWHPAQP